MSFFSGLDFYVSLFALLIPAVILGLRERSLTSYRTFLTAIFIFWIYRSFPYQLLYLLIYSFGSAYLVTLYLYLRKRFGRNRFLYGHIVLLALIPVFFSKGILMGKPIFGFLGISYLCFRVVQVIIEIYDGVITEVDFFGFLRFLLFFPSLSSGPIDRSRRFSEDERYIYTRDEYLDLLRDGVTKIILGMFYKIVLSAECHKLLTEVFAERYRPIYLIGYAYVYGLYLFFDFAGYSALAVGNVIKLRNRSADRV